MLAIGSFATYITTIIGLSKRDVYFWQQVRQYYYNIFALATFSVLIIFFRHVLIKFIRETNKNKNVYDSAFLCLIFSFFFLLVQQIANSVLLATAALIGLLCYFLGEAKQRRAFLEARKSLEVKMVIEEQSAEQVCIFVYVSRFFSFN